MAALAAPPEPCLHRHGRHGRAPRTMAATHGRLASTQGPCLRPHCCLACEPRILDAPPRSPFPCLQGLGRVPTATLARPQSIGRTPTASLATPRAPRLYPHGALGCIPTAALAATPQPWPRPNGRFGCAHRALAVTPRPPWPRPHGLVRASKPLHAPPRPPWPCP